MTAHPLSEQARGLVASMRDPGHEMTAPVSEIILMTDPKVAAVPVAECGERLVEVRRVSSQLVDDWKQQDSVDTFA